MRNGDDDSGMDADTRALLEAVTGFARAEIAARWHGAGHELPADAVHDIAQAARENGLLDAGVDGMGLWSNLLQQRDARFSVAALRVLARQHTGVAFYLHCLALGHAASSMIGCAVEAPLFLWGSHGLGRSALARWLRHTPLQTDEQAALTDLYGAARRVLMLPALGGDVMVPRFGGGQFRLVCYSASACVQQEDAQMHGLDGLHGVSWQPLSAPLWMHTLTAAQYATLLTACLLGCVAIALGAAERAVQKANEYVLLRVQGGRAIIQHDAVALLIAEQNAALQSVSSRLRSIADQPCHDQLAAALECKRSALDALCRAANAAMQVHGGSGYMRDNGVEDVVRDLNCLRVMMGAPDELALMSATLTAPEAAQLEHADCDRSVRGFVAQDHVLSPQMAFAKVPVLRWLARYKTQPAWQRETEELPAPMARYRKQVRAFAETHLRPLALSADLAMKNGEAGDGALESLLQRAGKAGLLSDLLPWPLGSAPLSRYRFALAWQQALRTEELARVDGGLMLYLSAHNLGVAPVLFSGNVRVMRSVLLPAFRANAAGDPQLFAFAITEPGAGSDAEDGHGAAANKPGLVAIPAPGGWRLHGRKIFISGGNVARWVVAFAALQGEGFASWTAFLVDTRSDGFFRVRNEHKMGMRASAATELEFDGCFVPDERVLGGLRKGWALNRATLNFSRLPVAAMAVGFAQRATELATDFACRETVAGQPLLNYQNVQLALADMEAETAAIRALVWQYAHAWTPWQAKASIAKFTATDRAQLVIERGMDLMGEHSLLHAAEIEKIFRDNRLTRIFEGTNQINRLAVIEDQQPQLLAKIAAFKREVAHAQPI